MAQAHLIGRPEKVKHLRELLSDHQIVYLSSFFYSGKTVLLDQLADSLTGPVLRFCAGGDDWSAFTARASQNPNAVLLIDDLQQFPNLDTEEALTAFLENLPCTQRAVLAGRAKKPACLRTLMMKGRAAALDKDFVLFNRDEAEQLLLDYGLQLLPQDLDYLMNACWGSPFALQAAAQRMVKEPGKSVRTVWAQTYEEIKRLLIYDVVLGFPEQERIFLYNLSPFERFSEDMARIVTGRTDAPAMIERIEDNSWAFLKDGAGSFSFIPFVREALFYEMKNLYTSDYIDGQYSRAALYYELSGQIPEAIACYLRLNDTPKIRDLLIRDTQLRPANGDYVTLRKAYSVLPEEMILSSPELMKGMCIIESLRGKPEESEHWYQELRRFLKNTSPRDGRRRAAEEAIAYLDIGLSWRGTRNILQTLVATAKLKSLTQSASWRSGFNVAGNSVSLMNGGKDFCRWNPHGWNIYRLAKTPVEMALGRGGSGMGDIAIGECELESNLTGEYVLAMEKVLSGLSRVGDDLEMRCAAVGIQSRILTAEGNLPEALGLIGNLLKTLPDDAPLRLRENLTVHRLTLLLMRGETQEARSWLETDAPDETRDFIILDRYKYLLKLRLYIITGKFDRTRLLTAQLKQYFEAYDRPYMRIQLHMLQAMIDRRSGRGDWRAEMTAAVELAKRYRLARVIADEGMGILDMLTELELPTGPWEQGVLNLTRQQAARCPHYMKPSGTRPVFTDREYAVYSLLIAGYSNAKIGALLGISERTVKYYAGEIYQKLGVTTRAEAIARARELGDTSI